ncbi:hypothetical protein ES5_10127, partial [Dietzia cinnamea P4]
MAPHLGGAGAPHDVRAVRRFGQADVHDLDAAALRRGEQVGAAHEAEGDGERRPHVRLVNGARVGVDPAGQVHRHPRHASSGQAPDYPRRRLTQRSPAVQTHHTVDGDIGDGYVGAHGLRAAHPPARAAQGGETTCVHA